MRSHSSPHGMPLKIAQDLFSLGEVDHLLDAHQVVRTWIFSLGFGLGLGRIRVRGLCVIDRIRPSAPKLVPVRELLRMRELTT